MGGPDGGGLRREMRIAMHSLDHLKNLVVMVAADGAVNEQELAFLIDICVQRGLVKEDLQEAIAFALSNQVAIELPTDPYWQRQLLEDLLRAMAADGHLAEAEKALFAVVAAKMGIGGEQIDLLIDQILDA